MDAQYRSALDFLEQQLPMFQRVGAPAYKADLSRTQAIMGLVGNPQKQFKCIHVAGTNGKGSICSALAAIFTTCGYRTGLYTSPHLFDFRERMQIDGQMIDRDFVIHFVESIKDSTAELRPSFFEITTAMAFAWFAEKQVDIAIVETGLGGRLDSTNVVHPELSAITSISMDHQNFLGNTLEKIAAEKGGIIKPNVPVVIGENPPEVTLTLMDMAAERNSPTRVVSADARGLETDLGGDYQPENMRIVRACVDAMREMGWELPENRVLAGAQNVLEISGIRGRWEVVSRAPLTIADAAHNEAGVRRAMSMVRKERFQNLHVVWGMVADKDSASILTLLPSTARYYWAKPDVPRGKPAENMEVEAKAAGLSGNAYPSVRKALAAARSAAHPDDMIYIGGSIFVLAEALEPRDQT